MIAPGSRLAAVVKADAYGLGAARIARRMASHVDLMIVFGLDEAEVVHAAAPTTPLLAMMPIDGIDPGGIAHELLLKGLLHLVAHDAQQVALLERVANELGVRIPLHIEVDTGLGRGGSLPEQALRLVAAIKESAHLSVAGALTHYANAGGSEAASDIQRTRFESWIASANLPPECVVHSASTFAAIRHDRFHHQMVRIGLGWTGLAFEGTRDGKFLSLVRSLRPVFSWRSRVMQVRNLPAQATVGYGSRWVARVPSVIGLLPVGYADGYPLLPMDPRTLRPPQSERRIVRVARSHSEWEVVPVIGAVSMDQIAIDLTTVASVLADGGRGATVELVSADPAAPNHAARLAAMTGQHVYEFMCGIPARVPRMYTAAEEPIQVPAVDKEVVARQAS